MGPFELQDLVGIDVGFEVSKSFYAQSLRRAALAADRCWRADGRRRPPRAQDRPRLVRLRRRTRPGRRTPTRRRRAAATGCLVDRRRGSVVAEELRDLARGAGWTVATPEDAEDAGEVPFLIIDCGHRRGDAPLQGGPRARAVRRGLAERPRPRGRGRRLPRRAAAGLGAAGRGRRAGRTRRCWPSSAPSTSSASLGKHVEWVGDAPGLVLGRHRRPARQRGGVRARRGRRQRRGHRRRHGRSASTTRAGRWPGATSWASTTCSAILDGAAAPSTTTRRTAPARCCASHVWDGRLGELTGAGFHTYPDGG